MLKPEEWLTIKTLLNKGLSQRAIARTLGISRNTVRRYIKREHPPEFRREAPWLSILEPYADYITERLREYPKLTADRLHRELQQQGFTGSYETVARFVREHRPDKEPQAYERFETLPGQQAQVDWGECPDPIIHFGVKRKVYAFTMTLGYSRASYVEFTVDTTAASLMRCCLNAFRCFGGAPQELLFDNMKTVVVEHVGDRVEFNPKFLDFAGHYGFEPKATRVCYPEGKGKVERMIGYLWSSFVTGQKFDGLAQMNSEVRVWLDTICNVRIHGTTGARPVDRLEEERRHLQPVRAEDYDICDVTPRKVHKDCCFSFRRNYYSVPHAYVGRTVQVKVYADRLKVVCADQVIAEHGLCPWQRQFIKDPAHFAGIVRRPRGALERYRRQFERYGEVGLRFLRGAVEECQPNLYYHWQRILALAEHYPDASVQTALAHCLDYRAFGYITFRNVLVKIPARRQPALLPTFVCGVCRPDLPTDVTRPLAYYDLALPAAALRSRPLQETTDGQS